MPYQKLERPRKCSVCGKQRSEFYVNPKTGRSDSFCASCSREKSAARRAARKQSK